MAIGDATKQTVREKANYLCEYCHSPACLSANRFNIEHVIPQSLGGSDDLHNLALACRRCNERRYNFVAGVDPVSQEIVPLFNPRSEKWEEHFVWLEVRVVLVCSGNGADLSELPLFHHSRQRKRIEEYEGAIQETD